MKDKKGHVAAYFYDDEGVSIKDQNGKYKDAGNPASVSTGEDFTPPYINSEYTDFVLNIPYSELHQTGSYSRTLKFKIIIWDMSAASAKEICRSTSYTSFLYTPVEEIYLTIDGNTSDKTKYFSESGGREIYYINTNASSYETWGVPSWCSIENKTSSSFTLVCSPNTSTQERKDWMKVKAGGKEIRIDIKQEGKRSATTIHNTWITHNLTRSMWNGYMWVNVSYMRIHCHFDVEGHKGENIRVCAFFYFANGNRVNAVNPEFRTSDGQATVQGNGHCDYEGTEWKDYSLDIPYYALPKGNLTVQIQIQDKNGGFLANSSHTSFTVY